jgi:hypothetical protein
LRTLTITAITNNADFFPVHAEQNFDFFRFAFPGCAAFLVQPPTPPSFGLFDVQNVELVALSHAVGEQRDVVFERQLLILLKSTR